MDQLDFALDDFLEGDVGDAHARAGGDQRRTAAVELPDALGNQIDQNKWVADNFGGFIKEIAFHEGTRAGRNRLCCLERNYVGGKRGQIGFVQNKRWEGRKLRRAGGQSKDPDY